MVNKTLVTILLLICVANSTTLNRVAVANAVCLDGSPYSYYISVGTESTKFYVYHQGGGWCSDLGACADRAKGDLGSSKNWSSVANMGDGMSRDPNDNPLMANWNFVYLPYCDGGSFSGDASSDNPKLFFQGLKIRQSVVASLMQNNGFASATDLVIGGCSAGGLAVYLHADWWANQVPNAKSRALPDSGFFLDGNYARDGSPNYEARMKNIYSMMNSEAGISSNCILKLGYKCLFAYQIIPFMKTPFFATNSVYDATMADGDCGHSGIHFDWNNDTSVTLCGNYVRGLFRQLLVSSESSVFLDACKHHCGEWNAITIDNIKSPKALSVWYTNGRSALPNNGYIEQTQDYPCTACCTAK